jgi:hypothetical protein
VRITYTILSTTNKDRIQKGTSKIRITFDILCFNLEFKHFHDSQGWATSLASSSYVPDGNHDDDIVGYMIDEDMTGLVAATEQDPGLNVQIVQAMEDQAE